MGEAFIDFAAIRSRNKVSHNYNYPIIVTVFALTLLGFHFSYDPNTGKGSVSDGISFSSAFLAVACYLGWLPSLWEVSRDKRSGSLVLPMLIALVLAYLYLTFRTFYIQPGATVLAFIGQVFALVYVSLRTA